VAVFLESLTGPEATDQLQGATVLLPIGAIEQHGPHLPLSTDYVIAAEAARAVVTQLGDELDLFVLPPLAFSKSNEHAWSAGTMWLSNDTMSRVLDDIARCVAFSGASRLVFLNGHGGNSTLLNVACREARLAHDLLTFLIHPFLPPAYSPPQPESSGSGELGMGIHGGLDETAVMLHLASETVDMAKAERNVPEWLADNEHVKFGGTVQFGWLSNDFGPSGHIGDPTEATAEYGAELFNSAVKVLCDQLREICSFGFAAR
jgi:creatinine amidohydrolase